MSEIWATVRLGEVLTHRKEFVIIDDLHSYKRPRVQLHVQGIIVRDEIPGALIKTKTQQICRAGEFLVAEIDAKVGGFGIVPQELDGAIVSSHYFLFVVNEERLDRRFLGWFIETPAFREQVEAQGSTNYAAIRPSDVLRYKLPLPPLIDQQRIVARIDELAAKIAEACSLRQQAGNETEVLYSSTISALSGSTKWPTKTVGQIVGETSLRNGRSVKASSDDGVVRCLMLSAMRRGRIDIRQSKPVPLTLDEAQAYLVRQGDVYVMRGNGSKELCGQAGLVEEKCDNVIFPDLFIRVPLAGTGISPEFFLAFWNAGPVRGAIEDKAKTTSGIWKVNQGHIASTAIPIPDPSEQRRIVTYLHGIQDKVDALKRLQTETAAELDALLPAILDRAFKGEL